jgi:hypothetical protein
MIALLLLGAQVAGAVFSFSGLDLNTTIAEARTRYPRSSFRDTHVSIADADLRDEVRAIDLPGTGPNRRLKLYFERTTPQGNSYPSCDAIVSIVRKQYGEPSNVQEFDEERARNRRYVWSRSRETLSIQCFRTGRQPYSASDLTIAPS